MAKGKRYKRTEVPPTKYEERGTLYLPIKKLPEMKDWKPGEEYEISLKVKQTSLNENSAGFEVISAETDEEEDEEDDG